MNMLINLARYQNLSLPDWIDWLMLAVIANTSNKHFRQTLEIAWDCDGALRNFERDVFLLRT